MTMRQLVSADAPVLHTKARRIETFNGDLAVLIADMWETMEANRGTGLAAPQIGEGVRVLVAKHEGRRMALVNPCILKRKGSASDWEGCLSLPGVRVNVRRAQWVFVQGRDPNGKQVQLQASGHFARILQHEIDHLDGVLIVNHFGMRGAA